MRFQTRTAGFATGNRRSATRQACQKPTFATCLGRPRQVFLPGMPQIYFNASPSSSPARISTLSKVCCGSEWTTTR